MMRRRGGLLFILVESKFIVFDVMMVSVLMA